MISVVMPSYLGAYKRAAKNRDDKIVRAIKSVQVQTYKDWELLVIADGCEKTVEIVSAIKDKKVKLHSISKQALWSGAVRNKGLSEAIGDYACYLDIDDAIYHEWECILRQFEAKQYDNIVCCYDKDKRIAFMKAWTEYNSKDR